MSILGRYLAFVAVLSMGLPPAWCCAWPAKFRSANVAPADAPPCPHCKPTLIPTPEPQTPVSPCCCVIDDGRVGAAIERAELEPPIAVLWHTFAPDFDAAPARHAISEAPARRGQWPPIHVWNCLYLC